MQTLSFVDTSIPQSQEDLCDFYSTIKQELAEQTDSVVYSLMSDYQDAKFSSKHNGVIAGYGANTNQGISRNYNEDRISIILDLKNPQKPDYNYSKI